MKTKLFVLVAALALFATANSAADAATTAFTYSLNNTLQRTAVADLRSLPMEAH